MIKASLVTTGIFCFLICISCVKDVGKLPVATAPVTVGFCDSITYNKHIKPIITNNCAIPSCHIAGGTGTGNFTSFDELKEKVSSGKFKLRVMDKPNNNPMPASGQLPQAELDIIQCWLDKGANND